MNIDVLEVTPPAPIGAVPTASLLHTLIECQLPEDSQQAVARQTGWSSQGRLVLIFSAVGLQAPSSEKQLRALLALPVLNMASE